MGFFFRSGKDIHTSDQQLGGFRVQTSAQGLPVTLCYGQSRVTPNLGWYGDFTAIPHTTTQSSGGKGGGGGSVSNTSYTYTAAIILLATEGPIADVPTVWKDKSKTDVPGAGLGLFNGEYTQVPWSYLSTYHPTQAIAYRGTSYLAASAFDLGGVDVLPNVSFEVQGLLYSGPSNPDVNPASVLEDILTADKYGANFPLAYFADPSDMVTYCAGLGIYISPVYSELQAASDIVTQIAQISNCAPVWSEGVLKMIPFEDS